MSRLATGVNSVDVAVSKPFDRRLRCCGGRGRGWGDGGVELLRQTSSATLRLGTIKGFCASSPFPTRWNGDVEMGGMLVGGRGRA